MFYYKDIIQVKLKLPGLLVGDLISAHTYIYKILNIYFILRTMYVIIILFIQIHSYAYIIIEDEITLKVSG